jgi:hypothetical protein
LTFLAINNIKFMVKKAPEPDKFEREFSVQRWAKHHEVWKKSAIYVKTASGAECRPCNRRFKNIKSLENHINGFRHSALLDAIDSSVKLEAANRLAEQQAVTIETLMT